MASEANPLAGLKVVSMDEILDRVMERIGDKVIDFSNPLQKQRFRHFLNAFLSLEVESGVQRAVNAATEKAVGHVFRLMRDPSYQDKRAKYRKKRALERAEERAKKELADRNARMDYSKGKLKTVSTPKEQIQ